MESSGQKLPPCQIPELVFLGRSNVGKSSLINSFLGRKLARVSRTPGRTRALLFFRIGDDFRIVDFPGYGYAKGPQKELQRFRALGDHYYAEPRPGISLLLLDIRRDFSPLDLIMLDYLRYREVKLHLILTKADKLSKSKRLGAFRKMRSAGFSENTLHMVSSLTRDGVGDLRKQLLQELRKN